jgi:O-antigen/teichoic acid export membrane protein
LPKPVKSTSAPKLAFNFFLLSGGEALSKIFAFLAFAYLARLLGPDTYGDIEFALAVSLFFNLVVEGGLGLLGAREIAKDEKSVTTLTFHIVTIRFVLAICAFILLVAFALISNQTTEEKQLVILYGLTLFGTPGLLQWVFQGLDRMQWVAIATVMRSLLFGGFIFLFILDPTLVLIVPLIELGAIGCVVAFNFSIFRYFFGGFWQKLDRNLCFSLVRQALPIGLTQITWGLRTYLPIIILGLMVGGEEVGWFGAAHRIVIALHSFVWMYFFNIYPSISRCTQQEPEQLKRLLGKSLQVTSWAGIFIGVLGTLLAEPIIHFVYGAQYDQATIAFKMLIWLISFILISGHYMYTLFAYNKQWFELLSALCSAAISLPLNFFFISHYGFLGAAFALVFTEALVWFMNYTFVRRKIAFIPFLGHLTKPLIAGLVMTACFLIIPSFHFLAMGAAALLIYGLCMAVLEPTIINDVRLLISGNQ